MVCSFHRELYRKKLCLRWQGVVDIITAADVPGVNSCGFVAGEAGNLSLACCALELLARCSESEI